MVGWHHQLNEFEQTPGDSKGQGSPECRSSWGHRVGRDLVTEQQQLVNKSLWSVCEGECVCEGVCCSVVGVGVHVCVACCVCICASMCVVCV